MKVTWMAVGAMMIIPCAAMAQSKAKDSSSTKTMPTRSEPQSIR